MWPQRSILFQNYRVRFHFYFSQTLGSESFNSEKSEPAGPWTKFWKLFRQKKRCECRTKYLIKTWYWCEFYRKVIKNRPQKEKNLRPSLARMAFQSALPDFNPLLKQKSNLWFKIKEIVKIRQNSVKTIQKFIWFCNFPTKFRFYSLFWKQLRTAKSSGPQDETASRTCRLNLRLVDRKMPALPRWLQMEPN